MSARRKIKNKQSLVDDQQRELHKAHATCLSILRKTPNDPTCLHVISLIEGQLGRPAEAEKWIARAVEIRPDSVDIQSHYGVILAEQGRHEAAAVCFRAALAINPVLAECHYHLGNCQREMRQVTEAVASYQQALAINPGYVEALNNLGNLLCDLGRYADAINCHQRAINLRPDHAILHNNLGLSLSPLGLLDEAAECYQQALKLHPDYPEAMNNLGVIARLKGNFEESADWYRRALALRPIYPDALNNLGNALKDCGRLDEALQCYETLLPIQSNPDYRHNYALGLLLAGRWREGWHEYETRWDCRQMAAGRRGFRHPIWRGEAGKGRTLLIHAEQGFGDTIQFGRYATLAVERGWRVLFEVQPPLKKLMQALPGVEIVTKGEVLPDFDMQCPTLSLPIAFDTTIENVPATLSYLKVGDAEIAAWGNRLPAKPDDKTRRVGLVWAGSPRLHSAELAATNRRRSMNPELFAPIFDVPNIQFVNLQKGGAPAPERLGLIDVMEECRDFADTAALIMNLDLVISVDTAVAHLAAALGKPVWLMNRYDNCWRWLQNRTDTPWYPSMRLFRQSSPGDWASVVDKIKSELEKNL